MTRGGDASLQAASGPGVAAAGQKQAKTKSSPSPPSAATTAVCPPGAKVFMGNLPFDVTEGDVSKLLQMVQIGENKVSKINIAMGSKTKRPLGWLLVEFKDPETARMCVEATNGVEFKGRTINVNIKDPPIVVRKPILEHSVYLSNLDYSLTEIEIYNMCEDLVGPGLVVGVKIPLDKNRDVPRGFAHIEFKDADAVQLAVAQLNGVEVFERLLKAERMTQPSRKAPAVSGAVEEELLAEGERGRI